MRWRARARAHTHTHTHTHTGVGKGGTDGHTLFLVEKGTNGFSLGQQIKDKVFVIY